jgi:hypothetical protein
MEFNWLAILSTALIPLLVGMVWYNPKVFGTIWMRETGISADGDKDLNMGKVAFFSLVVAALAAFGLLTQVIHQLAVGQVLANEPGIADPNSEVGQYLGSFMAKYGDRFRTFRHGAIHGTLAAILVALPVIATAALWERRSWRYIAISTGYWIVCFSLMGGIICAFA